MKYLITIIISLISTSLSFAQVDNLYITLSNGNTIYKSSVEELIADSVKISSSGKYQWIKVDSIEMILQIKKSKFWQGAVIGLVSGAIIGGVIAKATYKEPESSNGLDFSGIGKATNTLSGIIAGGSIGFLAGGIIGSSGTSHEVYDLSQKSLVQKLNILKMIISKENKHLYNQKMSF